MKNKITTFKNIAKSLKPNCATLIGGAFDPFNPYYLKLLRWASKQSRPLIVIVHPDRTVSLRRGFISPFESQNKRASRIATLDFVDYVIISSKVDHDPTILRLVKPKFVIFQRDNPKYHKELFKEISRDFPEVKIKVAPFKREVFFRTSSDVSFFRNKFLKNKKNKISKKLLLLAQKSKAGIGKISAVLVKDGKIVAGAANSEKEEHAEILLLKNMRKREEFDKYSLYILIPPCIMCAEAIARSNLKNVYYLFNFGDKRGVKYLKTKGIFIKRCMEKNDKLQI